MQAFCSFEERDEAVRQQLLSMTGVERIRLLTSLSDNGNIRPTPRSERAMRIFYVPLPNCD